MKMPGYEIVFTPSVAIRANQASAAQKSPDCFLIPSPPDVSSDSEPSRPRLCVRREALGRLRRAKAAPHPAARPTRAASLARAFSPSRPRASAVGLGEARATGVSPPAEGRRFDHSCECRGFRPGCLWRARPPSRRSSRRRCPPRPRRTYPRRGACTTPTAPPSVRSTGARARATATTPSLVDSETHETRPSAPLRVAAPDPWASSAPSAASASSDTPPP